MLDNLSLKVDECHDECLADAQFLPENTKDCLHLKVLRVLNCLEPQVDWLKVSDMVRQNLYCSLELANSEALSVLNLDVDYSPRLSSCFEGPCCIL